MATNPRMGKVNTKMSKPGKWDSMPPKAGKAMPKGKAPRSVAKKEAQPKTGTTESTPKSTGDRKPGSGRAM